MIRCRTLLYACLVGMLALSSHASPRIDALASLNRDMWRPFMEGIARNEPELYVGIHSPDFYWVAPGSHGRIMDLAEYDADSRNTMDRRQDQKSSSWLEVRFLERNVDGDFAAERCVMKYVIRREGAPDEVHYSITNIFSRLEKGVWRMWLQFGDPAKGSEAMFLEAAPIDDLTRFEPKVKP